MERNGTRNRLAPLGRIAAAHHAAGIRPRDVCLGAVSVAMRDERLEAEVRSTENGFEWSLVTYLGQSFLVGAYRWSGAN